MKICLLCRYRETCDLIYKKHTNSEYFGSNVCKCFEKSIELLEKD